MSFPQPVPPSWKDLGKSANDLLGKDYNFNGYALEVKTKTPSSVLFKVAGSQSSAASAIAGDIEGKWTDKAHGLTLTQTWTTANVIKTSIELENQILKGLKLDTVATLLPQKGDKGAVINAAYKQSGFHTRAALDLFKGPTFTADTVLGRDGFLVGCEASYNVTEGVLKRYGAAVGYNAPEYSVALHALNNLNMYTASYYHKVSGSVEAGAKAIYDTKQTHGGVALEVGCKTYLDDAAFVKAKINNTGVLALGYTQSLRPGVKVSFGLAFDTQKLNDAAASTGPAHKAGAMFTFDS